MYIHEFNLEKTIFKTNEPSFPLRMFLDKFCIIVNDKDEFYSGIVKDFSGDCSKVCIKFGGKLEKMPESLSFEEIIKLSDSYKDSIGFKVTKYQEDSYWWLPITKIVLAKTIYLKECEE